MKLERKDYEKKTRQQCTKMWGKLVITEGKQAQFLLLSVRDRRRNRTDERKFLVIPTTEVFAAAS